MIETRRELPRMLQELNVNHSEELFNRVFLLMSEKERYYVWGDDRKVIDASRELGLPVTCSRTVRSLYLAIRLLQENG